MLRKARHVYRKQEACARHYSSFTNGFLLVLVSLYFWGLMSYIILAYK